MVKNFALALGEGFWILTILETNGSVNWNSGEHPLFLTNGRRRGKGRGGATPPD
jgi:hypothetical protein